jgi:hypothetical protein
MPKIFHGKSMVVAKVQLVAEHKQSLQMWMWWMLLLQQGVKQLKNKCSRIKNQGK